jgi:hypothetical protein
VVCSWEALAGEAEVQAHAQTDLRCEARPSQDGRDAQWDCSCGVGSPLLEAIDFEHPSSTDPQGDCQAIAQRCALLVEAQDNTEAEAP